MIQVWDIWDHFSLDFLHLPSGKLSHNYGNSPFSMGKSTISMVIFNSYVSHYQRVQRIFHGFSQSNPPLRQFSTFSAMGSSAIQGRGVAAWRGKVQRSCA
jgi:hypothetical protein